MPTPQNDFYCILSILFSLSSSSDHILPWGISHFHLYQFARMTVTKYYRLGCSNNRSLFSKTKVSVGQSLLTPVFLAWRYSCFLSVSSSSLSSVYVLISSSYKNSSHTGLGLTLITSFQLNYGFKDTFSKKSHILRYWGQGHQHINWGMGLPL